MMIWGKVCLAIVTPYHLFIYYKIITTLENRSAVFEKIYLPIFFAYFA
jgi:hypothetical protein